MTVKLKNGNMARHYLAKIREQRASIPTCGQDAASDDAAALISNNEPTVSDYSLLCEYAKQQFPHFKDVVTPEALVGEALSKMYRSGVQYQSTAQFNEDLDYYMGRYPLVQSDINQCVANQILTVLSGKHYQVINKTYTVAYQWATSAYFRLEQMEAYDLACPVLQD